MTRFKTVRASLRDLLGADYVSALCGARSALSGEPAAELRRVAAQKVDFFPAALQQRLRSLLPRTGTRVTAPVRRSATGASSRAINAATHADMAPVSGLGYYRVGEDGRLCLISKSEHYHAPLGHAFPGYRLLDTARRLGIANATHNSTRGHITRLLEERLVCLANGIAADDAAGLAKLRAARRAGVLNRVINLETGSLVVEAALKMALARFHRVDPSSPQPRYAGRVPVVLVMADDDGGLTGNYHGTTTLTQVLRGMWPALRRRLARSAAMRVHAVRPNVAQDLDDAFARFEQGQYKVAAFFHEFTMMNYGARRLSEEFIGRAYRLCRAHDVPVVADEIQSCLWCPGLFSFREYGVRPAFVAIGKGFPGGEYAASRLLFDSRMDCLPQFGALVTNGQEELASLAYLVTMRWAEANEDAVRAVGDHYQERLRELAERHPGLVQCIDGDRHMGALRFHELAPAKRFASALNGAGLDISVQSYKEDAPPSALTKLPIIMDTQAVDAVIGKMAQALTTG